MHISPLPDTEVDDLALGELIGQRFGQREDQQEHIAKWRADPQRLILVATLSLAASVPVAVCITRLAEPAEFEPLRSAFELEPALVPDGPYGSFQLLACAPSHQHQGYGAALAIRAMAWLKQRDAQAFVGVSWEHGGPDHSGHLFERGGFVRVASSNRFYQTSQAQSGQRCPRCIGQKCSCVAHLYMLNAGHALIHQG